MAVGYTRAPRTGAQDSVPSADPRRDMATVTKDTNAEATIREIIANHEVFAEGIAASMARYMAKIENANPLGADEDKYYDTLAICAANSVMADMLRTVYPESEDLWQEMLQQVDDAILAAKNALAVGVRKSGF